MTLSGLRTIIKNGLVLDTLMWRIAKWGILVTPYYIFQEDGFDAQSSTFDKKLDLYESGFLAEDDMDEIAVLDGEVEPIELARRLESGHLCFGLKDGDKIAAFTWCDLKEFNHRPCRHVLKKNEAYLYDARVAKDYRGKNIAPYMRYQCYRALKQYSVNTFFSCSYWTYRPAIRFKKKIGARILKLCLYVNLCDKFSRNWVLKDYSLDSRNTTLNSNDKKV